MDKLHHISSLHVEGAGMVEQTKDKHASVAANHADIFVLILAS